jgi:hypothetical protein
MPAHLIKILIKIKWLCSFCGVVRFNVRGEYPSRKVGWGLETLYGTMKGAVRRKQKAPEPFGTGAFKSSNESVFRTLSQSRFSCKARM